MSHKNPFGLKEDNQAFKYVQDSQQCLTKKQQNLIRSALISEHLQSFSY